MEGIAVNQLRLKGHRTPVLGFLVIILLLVVYWLPVIKWMSVYGSTSLPSTLKTLPIISVSRTTTLISATVAAVTILGAYPLVLFSRIAGPMLRKFTNFVMLTPLMLGLIARNYSWIAVFTTVERHLPADKSGIFEFFLFSSSAVDLVMSFVFLPVAYFMILRPAMAVPNIQFEAAKTLGLSDLQLITRVLVPQTLRSLILAYALIFAMAIGYFVTPRMIGGGHVMFLGNLILSCLNMGRFEAASAAAITFIVVAGFPTLLIAILATRERFRT